MDEYKSMLHTAFERGLDSEEIVAYHGTSLQVLEIIMKTGIQPGTTYHHEAEQIHLSVRESDVFVYPIEGRTRLQAHLGNHIEKTALWHVKSSAEDVASAHYFFTRVSMGILSLDDLCHRDPAISSYLELHSLYTVGKGWKQQDERVQPMLQFLSKKGYTQEGVDQIVTEARKRKGIIIGYGSSLFEKGNPLQGNDGNDIRVQGVTISDIHGIEPLDQEAYDFLNTLLVT